MSAFLHIQNAPDCDTGFAPEPSAKAMFDTRAMKPDICYSLDLIGRLPGSNQEFIAGMTGAGLRGVKKTNCPPIGECKIAVVYTDNQCTSRDEDGAIPLDGPLTGSGCLDVGRSLQYSMWYSSKG